MKKIIFLFIGPALFAATPQYQSPDITVPAASAGEAVLKQFSLAKADDYLEKGALAWTRKRGCVTCHTTGTYMQIRPELTSVLGKPTEEIRDLLTGELAELQKMKHADLLKKTKHAEIIYAAEGMAQWERRLTGTMSAETQAAME